MTDKKMCRGHFHAPGTLVSLDEFYFHKTGTRAGKPFSQCARCTVYRRLHPKHADYWNDFVPLPVETIEELRRRLGPGEAARRAGLFSDALLPHRMAKHPTMRRTTVHKLEEVLADARANGEDNFDPVAFKSSKLIPGGPPGARQKATRAMVAKWARVREERTRQERAKLARFQMMKSRRPPDLILADRYPVKSSNPDPQWWHFTGQEWLPRWGEEMLGSEF